jgi:hypothetical protein
MTQAAALPTFGDMAPKREMFSVPSPLTSAQYSALAGAVDTTPEPPGGATGGYNEDAAANYANAWAKSYNTAYRRWSDDCTNFVSQALRAGGQPDTPDWYYNANGQSGSWINAQNMDSWLDTYSGAVNEGSWGPSHAYDAKTPSTIWKGDVIQYNWDNGLTMSHTSIQEIGYGHDGQSGANGSLVDAHTAAHYGAIWSLWYWNNQVETTTYYFHHINT